MTTTATLASPPQTASLTGRAGQILALLEAIALPKNNKEALFNPLPLKLSPGKVSVVSKTNGGTSFVIADVEFPTVVAEATVTVDAMELIKFLNGFDAGEDVTVNFSDPLTIVSATRTCRVHVEAIMPPPVNAPPFVDGIPQYKTGPATTRAIVDAASLQGMVKDAEMIDVPAFPITLSAEGVKVSLGGLEAKRNSITRSLPVTVTGPTASATIGEDLAVIIKHAVGPVELQLCDKPNHPLAVESNGIRFVCMPRIG